MSVQGLKGLVAAFRIQKQVSEKAMRKGLLKSGLFLQRESQKIVPIDTSALKSSAATASSIERSKMEVVISYGTAYALYVHEDLEARHKPGKTAKFLEGPFREHQKKLINIVKESIRGVI